MTKQELREKVWTTLEKKGAARFPGARGRRQTEGTSEQVEVTH